VSEQTPAGAAHGPADAPGGTLSAGDIRHVMDKLWNDSVPRSPSAEEAGFLVPPGLAEALGFSMTREAYPLPPPSWRTRLRWKRDGWREHAARRAFRVIAGYWPHDGEDDW
jgi:hypothetical protein